MNYTKAIYFKDGKSMTITEEECEAVKQRLLGGDKWLEVQGEFISADNVARVGSHHATADMKKLDELDTKRIMITSKEPKRLEATTEADYWIDENGEKMYS